MLVWIAALTSLVSSSLAISYLLLVAFVPRLGIAWVARSGAKRHALAFSALGLAAGALALGGGGLALGAAIVALVGLAAAHFFVPTRIFAVLDRTRRFPPTEARIPESTEVLGYEEGGTAAAWPILPLLAPRHLVNDEVAGRAILVSYCPACRTGVAFSRTVGGRVLSFEVAGFFRKNMVMRDRESGTLWQQGSGEALHGPLRGTMLDPLFAEQATWAAWLADHPGSDLCLAPDDAPRSIVPEHLLERMILRMTPRLSPPGLAPRDRRLGDHDEVVAVTVGGEVKAYPVALLVAQQQITDAWRGAAIRLEHEASAARIRLTVDGSPARVDRHWWLFFSEHHPGAALYGA